MKAPYMRTDRKQAPAGTFMARVCQIVYIGTVDEEYKGEPKQSPKVRIGFELPTETAVFKDGDEPRPFVVSGEYTHSMGKKSRLRPMTEAIIGTTLTDEEAFGFDHDRLSGMACQVTVAHKNGKDGSSYANVVGVSPILKGAECPAAVNPPRILSYEKWDQAVFDALPRFIKEKMERTPEYRMMKGMKVDDAVESDGIPF